MDCAWGRFRREQRADERLRGLLRGLGSSAKAFQAEFALQCQGIQSVEDQVRERQPQAPHQAANPPQAQSLGARHIDFRKRFSQSAASLGFVQAVMFRVVDAGTHKFLSP